jgi:hypothetical protein
MKLKHLFPELQAASGELIAAFGRAELIKTPAGKYSLRGGSSEEQAEAREWVSLFMHEVILPSESTPACR